MERGREESEGCAVCEEGKGMWSVGGRRVRGVECVRRVRGCGMWEERKGESSDAHTLA